MTDAIHPGAGDGRSPAAKRGLFERKNPGETPKPEIVGNRCGDEECGSYRLFPHCNNAECQGLWCARCLWEDHKCSLKPVGNEVYPDQMRKDAGFPMAHRKPVETVGKVTKRYVALDHWGHSHGYKEFAEGWKFDLLNTLPDWPVEELKAMLDVVAHIKALPGPDTW